MYVNIRRAVKVSGKNDKEVLKNYKRRVNRLILTSKRQENRQAIQEFKRQKEIKRQERNRARIERNKINNWLMLDNAATIYPSIREENWDFVYRVSVVFKDKVNPDILQKAVDDIMPRFPSFSVKLKSGFFWNYFEVQDGTIKVEKERQFPCQKFAKDAKYMVRVLYFERRIAVECFHAIADGRSSLKFLNSIIKRYIELLGVKISGEEGCLNYKDKPQREELQDSFFEYCDKSNKLAHKEVSAYRIRGTNEDSGVVNSTIGIMSVSQLKDLAKQENCKLFEYLIAVLAYSIWKRARNPQKPVKISVPIDLRRFFETDTLRNFSAYLNVEIPPASSYQLQDIIEIVKREFCKITKERMQSFINSNVAMQKNIFIKIVPLVIKNPIIRLCFKVWGESYQTLSVSNLGSVSVPKEFAEYIDLYECNLGRPKYNSKSVGLISYGDKMVWTFSSKIKENTTEKDFFKLLAQLGADIEIDSNRRDLYE